MRPEEAIRRVAMYGAADGGASNRALVKQQDLIVPRAEVWMGDLIPRHLQPV
jgi:hypothetical protein